MPCYFFSGPWVSVGSYSWNFCRLYHQHIPRAAGAALLSLENLPVFLKVSGRLKITTSGLGRKLEARGFQPSRDFLRARQKQKLPERTGWIHPVCLKLIDKSNPQVMWVTSSGICIWCFTWIHPSRVMAVYFPQGYCNWGRKNGWRNGVTYVTASVY